MLCENNWLRANRRGKEIIFRSEVISRGRDETVRDKFRSWWVGFAGKY